MASELKNATSLNEENFLEGNAFDVFEKLNENLNIPSVTNKDSNAVSVDEHIQLVQELAEISSVQR